MRGWFTLTLGLLATVLGALWTIQGLDYLDGSWLSGHPATLLTGPPVLLLGLATIVAGLRIRRHGALSPAATAAGPGHPTTTGPGHPTAAGPGHPELTVEADHSGAGPDHPGAVAGSDHPGAAAGSDHPAAAGRP